MQQLVIYQAPGGEIELRGDISKETVWATLNQITALFETDKSGISRHINNILKTGELDNSTVAKFATVQNEGNRQVSRQLEYFNLDMILSVGYRVNSKKATKFRQWATKTLRKHLLQGYTINKSRIAKNYASFMKAVDEVKSLLLAKANIETEDVLELIKLFADTWFSLAAYDKSSFSKGKVTKKKVSLVAAELKGAVAKLRARLMEKKEASELFALDRGDNSLGAIVGNVLQTFNEKDLYPSIEEKAAHLLYFIVKGHPFVDGNKRSGAFAFIWLLNKAKRLNLERLNSTALTALTLLIAQSEPKKKEKLISLVVMLIKS